MKKFTIFLFFLLLTIWLIQATPVLADITLPSPGTLQTGAGETVIAKMIGHIASIIIGAAGAFALLMFVYGGFTWITSRGSSEEINKGKGILVWSVIGLVVILFARVITDFIILALTLGSTPTPPPPIADSCSGGACYQTAQTCEIYGGSLSPALKLMSGTGSCQGSETANPGQKFTCCVPAPQDPSGCLDDGSTKITKDANNCCSTNSSYYGGKDYPGISGTQCNASGTYCCDCGLTYESQNFACLPISLTSCPTSSSVTIYRGTTTNKIDLYQCPNIGTPTKNYILIRGHCGSNPNIFCAGEITDPAKYNDDAKFPQFKIPTTP